MHVKDPVPIVRAKSAAAPMVIDGDGEGVVDVAGAGLLTADRVLLYAAPYEKDPSRLRALPASSTLVVTDSNRRRGVRWSGLRDNYGYTEQAGEKPLLDDPSDQRLEVFPGTDDAARTVAVLEGVKSVRATRYGSAFGFEPKARPASSLDGDLNTSWLVDQGVPVGSHRIVITLQHPVTTDHLNLVQYFHDPDTQRPLRRFLTRIGVRLDNGPVLPRTLNDSSQEAAGQVVRFPRRTFSKVALSFNGVPEGRLRAATVRNPVGFTEIRVGDAKAGAAPVRVTEAMRMPRTLLAALGKSSAKHPLALVMSRESTMDRSTLNRDFDLPTPRTFSVSGTAVLGDKASDSAIDQSFGLADSAAGGVTATSTSRLTQPAARASSALDGDPTTAWQTAIENPRSSIHVVLPAATALDHLNLQVVADGRHSVPARVEITADDGTTRDVKLPAIPVRAPSGVVSVPVSFDALNGQGFTVAITGLRQVQRSAPRHADRHC